MASVPASEETRCGACGAPLHGEMCAACSLRLLLDDVEGTEEAEGGNDAAARRLRGAEAGDRYRLTAKIASGGMGVVWAAEDRRLGRTVALKMLRGARFAEEGEMARFSIEAAAAAGLDHPHIVPIYEAGRLEGQPFFTMKLIDGGSLAQRLREQGPLTAREAASLMAKIARAVQHAHSRGVLHRDLKPGNILLDATGEPWLTDFGLAKVSTQDSGLTISSDHLGTPHYMAPEAAAGHSKAVSTSTDVWALGVILWETLTGRPPFVGKGTVEIMRRIIESEPDPPAPDRRINADLLTLARACLEKEPARRPASAAKVAEELERWQRGEPMQTRPVSSGERLVRWIRRKPAFAALYAALALGGLSTTLNWQRAEQAVTALTEANARIGTSLRVATATRLAAEARLQISNDAPVSLLLAAKAVELAGKTEDVAAHSSAESALMDALGAAGGFECSATAAVPEAPEFYVGRSTAHYRGLHFSPDGRRLITFGAEAGRLMASLHDLQEDTSLGPVRRWAAVETDFGDFDACWTADSRKLVTVGNDFVVRLWDLQAHAHDDNGSPKAPPSRELGRFDLHVDQQCDIQFLALNGNPCGLVVRQRIQAEPEQSRFVYHSLDLGRDPALGAPVTVVTLEGRPGFLPSADRSSVVLAPSDLRARRINHAGQLELDVASPMAAGNAERIDGPVAFHAFTRDGQAMVMDLAASDPEAFVRPPVPARLGGWLAQVSPDGRWLLSTGEDPVAWLTSLENPAVAHPLRTGGRKNFAASFSPDSTWAVVGSDDRLVSAWKIESLGTGAAPLNFRGLSRMPMAVSFSPDGRSLAAMGMGGVARWWRFDRQSTGAIPWNGPPAGGPLDTLAVSPDGRWIVSTLNRTLSATGGTPDIVIHDTSQALTSRPLTSHRGAATSVAFCPRGRWLATAGRDNTIKVHDWSALRAALESGTRLPEAGLTLSTEGLRDQYSRYLALHPRGTLYCATGDGQLLFWDLTAADPDSTLAVHQVHSIGYLLPGVAVSPDGHWLAIARHGWDAQPGPGSKQFREMVLLFDVSNPQEFKFRGEWTTHFLDRAGLSFSPDSRYLAIGAVGQPPEIWNLADEDPSAQPRLAPVSAQDMNALAFSQDGNLLALGGSDRRLYLWNWRSGSLRSWNGFDAHSSLAWLPGNRLASAGADGRVRVWETNLSHLIPLARRTAGRDLTPTERARFNVPGD